MQSEITWHGHDVSVCISVGFPECSTECFLSSSRASREHGPPPCCLRCLSGHMATILPSLAVTRRSLLPEGLRPPLLGEAEDGALDEAARTGGVDRSPARTPATEAQPAAGTVPLVLAVRVPIPVGVVVAVIKAPGRGHGLVRLPARGREARPAARAVHVCRRQIIVMANGRTKRPRVCSCKSYVQKGGGKRCCDWASEQA